MNPSTDSYQSHSCRGRRGRLTTYDLVSRGKDVENKNQCWGTHDATAHIGYGPGYENFCIHSGSNEYSGGDSTWYNYALASAGTIIDENTTQENPATNTNTATESICPKGWTLPSRKQVITIGPASGSATYISNFSPVLGGHYSGGEIQTKSTRGRWWASTAYDGIASIRSGLYYDGSSLYTYNDGRRYFGLYIRCVQAS